MKSMTGYGYKEISNENLFLSVEIKSWNSRFLDLSVYLPSFLGRLEKQIREKCASLILRGKVDLNIKLKEKNSDITVNVDENAAKAYSEAIKNVASALNYNSENIPISLIINQEGVLSVQKNTDFEKYWTLIEPVLNEALTEFSEDRSREGENLKKDLLEKLERIEQSESIFKSWIPKMEGVFRENLENRFQELLGENYDEQRVMTEIAAMLVKYTISEEVVRLQSHIDALKSEIQNNPAPGRKIDFICQEMNREINTIGSKNQFLEVGQAVIEAKDALENIREQAKNVE